MADLKNNLNFKKKYPFISFQYYFTTKEINKLIEESAIAKLKGNLSETLEKAKDAFNKEKVKQLVLFLKLLLL